MADKGSWSATAATAQVVAANEYRGTLLVQLHSGDPVCLGLGVAAVFGEGILLKNVGDFVEIRGSLARGAVNVICDTANTAGGGYQES